MTNQSIPTLLVTIEAYLQSERPDYFARLMAGASSEQLAAFESRLGMTLPSAFHELYRWRNGQDPNCFEGLSGNQEFMGLGDILETKEMLDDMIGTDFDEPTWWRRGWVPFLSNGAGSYLCIDMQAEDDGAPGQLIEFWKADADRPITYPSLAQWLSRLAASMDDGTYEVF